MLSRRPSHGVVPLDLERVAAWIAASRRVTVLTGAGISTDSGIPDYRGPNGVWTKDPAAMRRGDIDVYLADPETRRASWQERLHHATWTAVPNAGHRSLVELERRGRLRALVTQNIDGLHQAAGSSPELVIELHGTIHRARCLACGRETPMQEQLDRVRAGDVLERAIKASTACDLFLAIGTSLQVTPASLLCATAQRTGARTVIVNAEPTPFDERADAVLRGRIGDVLSPIVG